MFQPRNEKRESQEITSPDLPPKSDPEAVLSADKPAVSQAHVTSQQVKFSFAILTEKVSATSIYNVVVTLYRPFLRSDYNLYEIKTCKS